MNIAPGRVPRLPRNRAAYGRTGRSIHGALVLALLLTLCAEIGLAQPARGQSSPAAYTSERFGYTIAWDPAWQISEQSGDAVSDSLSLVDGTSFVFFSGRNDASDAQAAVDEFGDFLREDDSFANAQPRTDCPAVQRSVATVTACFTFLRLYDDGRAIPEAALLEGWDLGDGVRLLMVATVAEELFERYLPVWGALGVVTPDEMPATGSLALAELEGVRFSFDPGVTERDRVDAVEGIRLGQTIIAAYLGLERLNEIQVNVLETASAERPLAVASARGFTIEVYAGGRSWQTAPSLLRIETLVHELTHVYQNQLLGPGDRGVPLWFDEGAAEAIGFLAIAQIGVLDQDDIYQLALYFLTRYPVSGSLAQFAPMGSLTTDAYPLSYLAVQYLLGRSGLSVAALGDFYRAVGDGTSVEDAFLGTFSISLEEFYVEFDDWRTGLQAEFAVPPDFTPPTGTEQAAPASWLQIQSRIERGDQLYLVASTGPGAICALELRLGEGSIERETFANSDGEVFWLVTIPMDVTPGTVTASASCGATPAEATVEIE